MHFVVLLESIDPFSSTERTHAIRQTATVLATTETALTDDLRRFEKGNILHPVHALQSQNTASLYSSADLTLGLFLLYPRHLDLLAEMIIPEDPFAARLHTALSTITPTSSLTLEGLLLSDDDKAKARILQLYCEENGLGNWSETISIREVRQNCKIANHEQLHKKQKLITGKLLEARKNGDLDEKKKLEDEYFALLMKAKMPQGV